MYKKVLAFCGKCHLLKNHLQQHNFFHFPQLTSRLTATKYRSTTFQSLFSLMYSMQCCRNLLIIIQILKKNLQTLRLVAFPHLIDTESAPLHLQMELMELKNKEKLVAKFKQEENLIETWKSATKYPLLRELATLVLFGSTYVCKSAFSMMKYLKNEYCTRLLDRNLESQLKLMVSREVPDFARLSAHMQDYGSH